MPAMVLRDRASRTEHPETKKRLLDLAKRKEEGKAAVQADTDDGQQEIKL